MEDGPANGASVFEDATELTLGGVGGSLDLLRSDSSGGFMLDTLFMLVVTMYIANAHFRSGTFDRCSAVPVRTEKYDRTPPVRHGFWFGASLASV